jgi:flagellin-like hook-associated protein FlgL
MNSISSQNLSATTARAFAPSPEILGRSLQRLSSQARVGLPDTASANAVSRRYDAQDKRVQAALGDVQQAASAVQTADAFLGGLGDILGQMGEVTQRLADGSPDAAADLEKFATLQQQLRAALGKSAPRADAQTMGTPDVSFEGEPLFGPEDRAQPAGAGDETAKLPKFRLRGAALGALMQQKPDGAFALGGRDSRTGDAVKSARQDVQDARSSVTAAGQRLQLEAATLQVESENLSSVLTPIRDEAAGDAATRAAAGSMLLQPGAVLRAQGNIGAPGVLKVLET